ncbi:MAG: hypothetical protein MUF10_07010 [Thermoanaerobaculaceae bacterium]|nr:hypothetical protein [Thermoanaerobaculaceae bacterium]
MTLQQHSPTDTEVMRRNRRAVAHLASLAFRRAQPFDVISAWQLPAACEMVSHLLQGQPAFDYARIRYLLCFCNLLGGLGSAIGRRRFDRLANESPAVLATRSSPTDHRASARDLWPAIGSGCPRVGKALEKNLLAPNGWASRGSSWVLDKKTSLVVYGRDWGTYRSYLHTTLSFPCLRLDSLPIECSKFFAIDTNSFLSYSKPDFFQERYEKFLRLLVILGNAVRRIVEAPAG